jgi:hypothetical protein
LESVRRKREICEQARGIGLVFIFALS